MSIKFEIYRDGKRLTTYVPVNAMAMGPESVPIPGDVSFKDGLLTLSTPDDHATGFALLWDLGAPGAYHLETTRLQHRTTPYLLNVELARFRLMKIVQKQEDWNLFDFPRSEKFLARFREANLLLADALGRLDTPEEASKFADQALAISVELSEQLANFHCDLLLNRRKAGGAFSRHIFGCRVDPSVQNSKFRETLATQFDYAILPMNWKDVQPQEQAFQTSDLDEWVELLSKRRVPIIAGPLIDLTGPAVPDWMFIWEHDFDTMRELAYEYVQKLVGRYRKHVGVWNVAAGLHTNGVFPLSFEQAIELTRLLVSQVKALMPGARTIVTVKQVFGEYGARGRQSVPPLLYAEMVAQAGINFEAFGLELELGVPVSGSYLRDLFQISVMLDKFSTLGKPVFLTCVGVPGRSTPDSADASGGKNYPSQGGRWKRPWDADLQAEWMDAVYKMALSKPYVESIAWGNLADQNPTIPGGGLLDDLLRPKPAFVKLQQMREQYHQFHRK